jgi:hypothetical protein
MSQRIIGYNLYLKPDHPTRTLYLQALGQAYIPVTTPIPYPTRFEDLPTQPAYFVDMGRLTPRQQVKLKRALAEQFSASYFDVALQVATYGLPVLDRDCAPPTPVYAQ